MSSLRCAGPDGSDTLQGASVAETDPIFGDQDGQGRGLVAVVFWGENVPGHLAPADWLTGPTLFFDLGRFRM